MKNKFTPDEFRSWVEWTRQRLPAEGDIPAILGDEWNNIRENQSPPWFDSIWSHYEDFDSRHDPDILNFIANESVLNPDDLACRFTALRYLYELSQTCVVMMLRGRRLYVPVQVDRCDDRSLLRSLRIAGFRT